MIVLGMRLMGVPKITLQQELEIYRRMEDGEYAAQIGRVMNLTTENVLYRFNHPRDFKLILQTLRYLDDHAEGAKFRVIEKYLRIESDEGDKISIRSVLLTLKNSGFVELKGSIPKRYYLTPKGREFFRETDSILG